MKTGLRMGLAFGFGVALLQLTAAAQVTPAAPNMITANTATNAPKLSPEELKHNMSYAIGTDIGNNLKRGGVELDMDVLANAMKDAMAGQPSKLNEQQVREAINNYRQVAQAKREEERRKSAEKNRKEGSTFLAENKAKSGVKTHEVKLPDGTMAEMQYKVITEGTGEMPKSNDVVVVNYRGTLINGKEFDNSAKRGGQPAKFPVNRVVKGWTEALQMMKTGSKWELYLPASLAYGDNGYGQTIEPGATLIFEMELTGIEAPPPPAAPPAPLTSDIIRVPSAEELKKGAKIEVIKPEDLEKLTNAAAQKQEKK
ncbi:MAG: FKBP-type peptidyl-prolyl cis-trans isomerase [Verrucomicrobia bacterium]|nr:FKBP-type peptidyl-prolyl cis-trans isomerase [Verrucomicrobiota bacterium]